MKTQHFLLGIIGLTLPSMLFIQSCNKDEAGSINKTDLSLTQDQTYTDALYDEVDNLVQTEIGTLDISGYNPGATKSTADEACLTITVDHPDSTTFPKVITLDYGEGCDLVLNNDTITRSGQIIITLTNRWYMEGAQETVTFHNFYINGVKIEGIRTITNDGINASNHLEQSITLQQGKVSYYDETLQDTAYITREANHVREWIRKENPLDDTVLITGTATGTNILGEQYTREITDPLVFVHCQIYPGQWAIAGGTLEITNSNRGTTTVTYSGTGCSTLVKISKNGNTYRFTFSYRHIHR